MNRLIGYWRTLRQYWHTPKGRRDLADYVWAAALIVLTVLAVTAGLTVLLARG
ncbi:MAG: hypothetical protein ACFNWW_06390 [Negativicutes bacterium]